MTLFITDLNERRNIIDVKTLEHRVAEKKKRAQSTKLLSSRYFLSSRRLPAPGVFWSDAERHASMRNRTERCRLGQVLDHIHTQETVYGRLRAKENQQVRARSARFSSDVDRRKQSIDSLRAQLSMTSLHSPALSARPSMTPKATAVTSTPDIRIDTVQTSNQSTNPYYSRDFRSPLIYPRKTINTAKFTQGSVSSISSTSDESEDSDDESVNSNTHLSPNFIGRNSIPINIRVQNRKASSAKGFTSPKIRTMQLGSQIYFKAKSPEKHPMKTMGSKQFKCKESTSKESKSKESESKEFKSSEFKSKESKSEEFKSNEFKPKESKSKEIKSKHAKSKDTKSKEFKSNEFKSKESKSNEFKHKEEQAPKRYSCSITQLRHELNAMEKQRALTSQLIPMTSERLKRRERDVMSALEPRIEALCTRLRYMSEGEVKPETPKTPRVEKEHIYFF